MLEGSNLLAWLRPADRALMAPMMTEVSLPNGHILYEPGEVVRQAFFPRYSALAVYLVPMDNGDVVETAMVGREGALGGVVSMGSVPAYSRSCVMHGGSFYRIETDDLDAAKVKSDTIRDLFVRYADCLMAQVFQSVACNARHTIEQRAAKWVGAAIDRTGENELTMTQEQLAGMMGIGRSYASRVVQRFKHEGLLRTRRGGLTVLDLPGLRRHACTCNELVRQHFDTVLRGVYPN